MFDELHGKFSEDNEREDFLNMKVLYKTMTQVIVGFGVHTTYDEYETLSCKGVTV